MAFTADSIKTITTLGQLKAAGYKPQSIKEELRANLIHKLSNNLPVFAGIFGYEDTVVPELERALLSMHNINLLGLRGQAKTRIARQIVELLDDYIPYVAGSELNDCPLQPITRFSKDLIFDHGDNTPIAWLHRDDRFTEKLATPDVSVADLIGDVDPIKAATLKLPYSDERVIHYGLIPRSHRCIFVINELPDLQPRIQVSLFNILQEGDIQIRGFKLRLPLDIQFVFTANPEDYTNRGSIVTPLKDRIDSQIITHYPDSIEIGKKITAQEAQPTAAQAASISMPILARDIIEQIAFEARESEFIDAKSGVSARLTIAAMENLYSAAELRLLQNGGTHTQIRIADIYQVIPAITGKVELVYEGQQEGAAIVAHNLIGKAIRTLFGKYLPSYEAARKKRKASPYAQITSWFDGGNALDLMQDAQDAAYQSELGKVTNLLAFCAEVTGLEADNKELYFWAEFILHGLAEHSALSKKRLARKTIFQDLLSSLLSQGGSGNKMKDNPKGSAFDDDDDDSNQ